MDLIEVAIGPINGVDLFKVDVVRSRAGEASVNVAMDAEMLLTRRAQLQQAVLALAVHGRAILSETERPLREVGGMLFSVLLGSGEVAGRYRASAALATDQGNGLRVVLRIDSALLAALPWEAMYDGAVGAYVCRRDQLVCHVPVPSVAAPLMVQPPLRILGIVSSPRGLPLLDEEREQKQLTHALSGLSNEGQVIVHWVRSATWAELQDLLLSQEWHVIHFIGHGDFDYSRDEGVLALVGADGRYDLVEANRLVDLLRQARPMPRLVVLNSCAGAVIGSNDLFSGTAAALVRGGVSAVAAMQYEISDSAATAFARGFYTAIASGRGVDDATSSGRVAIVGTGARTLEWVTPVLYMRGNDSHLFTLSSTQTHASATQRKPIEPGSERRHVDGSVTSAQANFISLQEPVSTGLRAVGKTAESFSREIDTFKGFITRAAGEMDRVVGSAAVQAVYRNLGANISQPIERMPELASRYISQMRLLDVAVRAYVSKAPSETRNHTTLRSQMSSDFASIDNFAQSARRMSTSLRKLIGSLDGNESMSRELGPLVQKMRSSIAMVIEASSAVEEWVSSIRDAAEVL